MGAKIFKVSNLRKAYYYLKKNGLKSAYYAACERIMREKAQKYSYETPRLEYLMKQEQAGNQYFTEFSILVPAYETAPEYLLAMIDSVLGQSYGRLSLIIADASRSDRVQRTVSNYTDKRIRYIRLEDNKGISENTNLALAYAEGDYIGLLDHDDVLAPDALYEMAAAIANGEKNRAPVWLLYSDEDKGNGEMTKFYEPHFKPELNIDLLLSNNYICHFLVMKKELMKELGFRKEYDGAQDYDLILRAVGRLVYERNDEQCRGMELDRKGIRHIPRVLYHWRCHASSTAENPESKRYAYEAGRRALEDFMERRGWKGRVLDTSHLGFYKIVYDTDIFTQRREVGAIGGKLIGRKGNIAGGIYDQEGKCPYIGLAKHFSGYMHRCSLAQEACALDMRGLLVRDELKEAYEEIFGIPYNNKMMRGEEYESGEELMRNKELEFGRRVWGMGYTMVWQPDYEIRI